MVPEKTRFTDDGRTDARATALALPTQSSRANKRPMGLDALLENQLGHLPKFHILSFYPRGRNWFFTLRAAVSEIRANFQNCHIRAWNLAIGQGSRSCTYTLFLPQEGEIELIFTLRTALSEIGAYFQNCHIWAWNLAVSQSSRSCTYTLFLPQGVKIELILALCITVSEIYADFYNCHIWAWNLALVNVIKVAHVPSFYPRGSKLSLFSLYG